jgi:hypothetical protein
MQMSSHLRRQNWTDFPFSLSAATGETMVLALQVTLGPAFAGARLFPAAADQVQERCQRLPRPLAWDPGTEE